METQDRSSHGQGWMTEEGLVTCLYFSNVNEVIFWGWCQHFPIMAKTEGPHRPIQPIAEQTRQRRHSNNPKRRAQLHSKWNKTNSSNKQSAGRVAYLEKHRTHTNSSTSQRLTKASALPVAKYFPMGSNLIQIQLEGWALMDCTGFSSG